MAVFLKLLPQLYHSYWIKHTAGPQLDFVVGDRKEFLVMVHVHELKIHSAKLILLCPPGWACFPQLRWFAMKSLKVHEEFGKQSYMCFPGGSVIKESAHKAADQRTWV